MALTSATGLFSGLDTSTLITQLVAIEGQPRISLTAKKAGFQAKISTYGSIKSALSTLKTSLDNLKSANILKVSAKSSDTSELTASVTSSANVGSHSIEVNKLATTQSLFSSTFTSSGAAVADLTVNTVQKLRLQVGSGVVNDITIDSTNNTVTGISDAINAANAGVTASVIDGGFVVDATNDSLLFNDGSNRTATLAQGTYTTSAFEAEIKRALEAANAGSDTYTVTYDTNTSKFTIANDAGNTNSIDLLFEDASTTAEALLGFTSVDHAAVAVAGSIISDNAVGGTRLVLSSNSSGTSGRIKVLTDEDYDGIFGEAADTDTTGLSQIAFDPLYDASGDVASGTANLTQSLSAIDAILKVDGVSVSSSSNTITNLLSGTTLTLLKTTTAGSPVTLDIEKDTAQITTNINAFISSYNSAINLVRSLSVPVDGQGVILTGDSTANQIINSLRSAITQDFSGNTVAESGLSHKVDGSLTLNTTTLDSVVNADLDGLIASFDGLATSLESTLDNFIDTAIPAREDGLNASISSIDDTILGINVRLVTFEETLRAKFTAMESILASLQSTQNFLTAALANLPKPNSTGGKK